MKLIEAINMSNKLLTVEQMERIIEINDQILLVERLSGVNNFRGFTKNLEYCYDLQLSPLIRNAPDSNKRMGVGKGSFRFATDGLLQARNYPRALFIMAVLEH